MLFGLGICPSNTEFKCKLNEHPPVNYISDSESFGWSLCGSGEVGVARRISSLW